MTLAAIGSSPIHQTPYKPSDIEHSFERAARILCDKRGVNADEVQIRQGESVLQGVVSLLEVPLWVYAAEELIVLSQCLTSLKEAAGKLS